MKFYKKVTKSDKKLCLIGLEKWNSESKKFMDAYNQYILTDKKEEISERLRMHWSLKKELAGECIACGKCEKACTQHLPIIDRLKEISTL